MADEGLVDSSDPSVGSATSRLVILRGNSGSGKSAVAAALRAARPNRTLTVVGQDHIRRTILGTGDDLGITAIGLTDLIARYALQNGFDVVVEGILNASRYGDMLNALRRDHRGVTRPYVYDLTFEETLRRHATKGIDGFGAEEMQSWWRGFQPVDGLGEAVIGEDESLNDTVARILADCWGVSAPLEPATRSGYHGNTGL